METFKKVLRWVMVSSVDPDKTSLTVKMFLLGLVPYLMQAIGITCGLRAFCTTLTATDFNTVALSASNVVFWGLSIVSSLGFIYGFFRKLFVTLAGNNAAFQ